MLWYHNNFDNRFGDYSLTPSMLDQYQDYSLGAGSIRNPLSPYGDNSFEQTRGGYVGVSVAGNDNNSTSVTLTVTIVEPILISPLVFGQGSDEVCSLVGVDNMSYVATFTNINRLLSIIPNQGAPGEINIDPVTGINVTLLPGSSLLFQYLTPDPLEAPARSLVSSYFSIIPYPTRQGQVATYNPLGAPATVSLKLNSIQLASIPRRMYLFARIDDALLTAASSDSYLALPQTGQPLQVTWNNNQFFSTFSTPQIYDMSVKNGLQMSYTQFVGQVGSVICIDFGTDLGLASAESSGLIGNYQLSVTCNFGNINPVSTTITPTFYCVIVSEGTFNIINGSCSHMIGVLSHDDVLNAKQDPLVTYKKSQSIYGGDFFSSLKNAFNKVNDFLKRTQLTSSVLSEIPHPYAQKAASFAKKFGYGVSGGEMMDGEGISGGKRKKKSYSRNELKDMIKGSGINDDEMDYE